MSAARDPLRGFFQCSDRERAIFEAGVKLGSVYHQFVGTPLDTRSVRALERAIEAGVRAQPNVQSVRARIDRAALRRGTTKMGYASLTGDMLDVTVTTRVGGSTAIGRLRYVASLTSPLMYIKRTS